MIKKLRTIPLAAIIFLTVSGGPYGLEPLLTYSEQHLTFLLLLIVPLLWDVPTIFVVLELNSMMPIKGGYYYWVKRAFGLRWAFFEGWWTWLYTFVDLAIYPVLFVQYAAFFFPGLEAYKLPVCLAVIWFSALLNIRGAVPVGKVSLLLVCLVLLPFAILFGIVVWQHPLALPPQHFHGTSFSTVGLAVYTIMWNFLGWDNTMTYAQDVRRPVWSYISSVAIAFATILTVYMLAMYAAVKTGIPPEMLQEKGFPAVGMLAGGNWLAALIAAGGMASALGLYSGVLLSVSRIPEVMANDQLLPQKLNKLHSHYGTPYISIIICSAVVSVMVLLTFESLVIIDVTLYGAALFLEYFSLIQLRKIAPNDVRPFKIRLNKKGLMCMTLFPLTVYVIAVGSAFISDGKMLKPVLFAIAALLSAELVWQVIKRRLISQK